MTTVSPSRPLSATTPSDHQLQIVPRAGVNTATANTPDFVQLLEKALVGGDAVYDFFSGHFSALNSLYETIATGGDEVWIDGTDQNGSPVAYVAQGSNYLMVSHQFTDTEPLQNGTGSTTTYKPVGIASVTFITDQGTSEIILNDIHYAGLGLGGLAIGPVLGKFALSLVKTVWTWVKNTVVNIYQRVTGGTPVEDPEDGWTEINDSAADAAEEAGETGADMGSGIFADVTITTAQGVLFGVGLGILAVVFILQLLAKKITAQFRFYNLTKADVTFGVCLLDGHTAMSSGPAKAGSTAVVPKVSKPTAPPNVIPADTGIYYADATLLNSNELYGVGYLLTGSGGGVPSFAVAVQIPSAAPNTMLAEFTSASCNDVWSGFYDSPNVTPALVGSATSGAYTLRIATNATQGRTPAPLTGATGYNYEHLIVLTDGSVPSS